MKFILRCVIWITLICAACCCTFLVGTIIGIFCTIVGLFNGLSHDYWEPFYFGVCILVGHILPIPFIGIYKIFYGEDTWYNDILP